MCTAATKTTKDGSVIQGRTTEFEAYYGSYLNFVPANHNSEVYFLNQNEKEIVPNKYSYLFQSIDGILGNGDVGGDGMNEYGLSVSLLHFNYHKYRELKPEEVTDNDLKWAHGVRYLLGNFKSVEEIKEARKELENMFYWPAGIPSTEFGHHLMIVDSTGASVVMEPEEEEFRIKDNPTGILTNSSPLEYHYENLRQYSHLTPVIQKPTMKFGKLENHKLLTVGNSLIGLPGDFQANSRYVRAAVINSTAVVANTADEGVNQMFRILSTADLVEGVIREELTLEQFDNMKQLYPTLIEIENDKDDVRTITSINDDTLVKDLTHLKFYWKTANNLSIRCVDFNDYLNKGIDKILRINLWEDESIKVQKMELK